MGENRQMRQMKNSGIEWIGEIPEYWICVKLKNKLIANDGGIWGNDPKSDGCDKIVIRSTEQTIDGKWEINDPALRDLSGTHYANCRILPDDLLVTKSSGSSLHIGKTTIADEYFIGHECYYSNFIQRLRIQDNAKYIWYILNSPIAREQFVYLQNSTSGIGNINANNINNIYVTYPPVAEQQKIVECLDNKCANIDGLIADIQAEIDTLEQYKRSVITETVTKGLTPNVEMRDSAVQWLGYIPSHWECTRGKYVLTYMQKPVKPSDGVITCFRDGQVTLRSNRREDGFTMADKEIGYQGIDIGDLVVHGMDGFAGAIGISDSRGKASPVLNVLDTAQNKRYIMYYLRSMAFNDVFTAMSTGIRVRSCDLRWNKLAELLYPIPPLAEQDKIVEYIDETLKSVNEVIGDKRSQIDTLDSYKKSIIFEYVTGKKEVI